MWPASTDSESDGGFVFGAKSRFLAFARNDKAKTLEITHEEKGSLKTDREKTACTSFDEARASGALS